MCGRYVIAPVDSEILEMIREINRMRLAELFCNAGNPPVRTEGEILPSFVVPAVATSRTGEQRLFPMKWGFRTATATGRRSSLLINARIETASEKPSFREAWYGHRCAIPASWYCEWEHDEKKRPWKKYAVKPEEKGIVWLAGLYHLEEGLPAFVILTRPADESLIWMHDRMPVMIRESDIRQWISPRSDPEAIVRKSLTRTRWKLAG